MAVAIFQAVRDVKGGHGGLLLLNQSVAELADCRQGPLTRRLADPQTKMTVFKKPETSCPGRYGTCSSATLQELNIVVRIFTNRDARTFVKHLATRRGFLRPTPKCWTRCCPESASGKFGASLALWNSSDFALRPVRTCARKIGRRWKEPPP